MLCTIGFRDVFKKDKISETMIAHVNLRVVYAFFGSGQWNDAYPKHKMCTPKELIKTCYHSCQFVFAYTYELTMLLYRNENFPNVVSFRDSHIKMNKEETNKVSFKSV